MVLEVEKLSFAYGARSVLEGISFSILRPGLTAVVGPNGAGKSTLLKCIMGRLSGHQGNVRIGGRDVAALGVRRLAMDIAYLPQKIQLVFPLTVFELILTGRRPHITWAPGEQDIGAVLRVMRELDIGHLHDRLIDELSGGEAQKVFIAMTLAKQSGIILLDEPTSSLDIFHQLEIVEKLKGIVRREGRTVIMAVHDLNLAGRHADRIIVMRDGRIAADGAPSEVLVPERIKEVYGVDASVHADEDGFHVICDFPRELVGASE